MGKGKNPLPFLYFRASISGEMSLKVVIERPKNILEDELLKDFQISNFKLIGGTLYYIKNIDENLWSWLY